MIAEIYDNQGKIVEQLPLQSVDDLVLGKTPGLWAKVEEALYNGGYYIISRNPSYISNFNNKKHEFVAAYYENGLPTKILVKTRFSKQFRLICYKSRKTLWVGYELPIYFTTE